MQITAFQLKDVSIQHHPWGLEAGLFDPLAKAVIGFDFEWITQPLGNRSVRYMVRYNDSLSKRGFEIAADQLHSKLASHFDGDRISIIPRHIFDGPANANDRHTAYDHRTTFDVYGRHMLTVPNELERNVIRFGSRLIRAMDHLGYISPKARSQLDSDLEKFEFKHYCPLRPEQRVLTAPPLRPLSRD